MKQPIETRLAEAEADSEFATDASLALFSLLVAHIEAMDALLPGSAAATTQIAEVKRRAHLVAGHSTVAEVMETHIAELRQRLSRASDQ